MKLRLNQKHKIQITCQLKQLWCENGRSGRSGSNARGCHGITTCGSPDEAQLCKMRQPGKDPSYKYAAKPQTDSKVLCKISLAELLWNSP